MEQIKWCALCEVFSEHCKLNGFYFILLTGNRFGHYYPVMEAFLQHLIASLFFRWFLVFCVAFRLFSRVIFLPRFYQKEQRGKCETNLINSYLPELVFAFLCYYYNVRSFPKNKVKKETRCDWIIHRSVPPNERKDKNKKGKMCRWD